MTALILASSSPTRDRLMRAAGFKFEIMPPNFDEAPIKARLLDAGAGPGEVAAALAVGKAAEISKRKPNAVVIGADQMLECEGTWYDKPNSRDAACGQLLALRGRTHRLYTAAVLIKDGKLLWRGVEEAKLTMRNFSDAFLETYLSVEGDQLVGSVGGYRVEEHGVQLFSAIEGDYFSVLGLPLMALQGALREQGLLQK